MYTFSFPFQGSVTYKLKEQYFLGLLTKENTKTPGHGSTEVAIKPGVATSGPRPVDSGAHGLWALVTRHDK